jgi:inorganic pyrophosphatase
LKSLYKAHPWHGIEIGEEAPETITAFIEILPSDTVKYEIDKVSGFLKIDRPQKFSNVVPAMYGFVPQTYCGDQIAALSNSELVKRGDGDPLDICVLSEKEIYRSDIILKAIPIGGLRLIDKGEADDKIIAVLQGDVLYTQYTDVSQLPQAIINRLQHYFLTYKNLPNDSNIVCQIEKVYGREEAYTVIKASQADYQNKFCAK